MVDEWFNSLTQRQFEIGIYNKKGLTAKDIGDLLGISPHTVRDHLKKMIKNAEVSGIKELAGLSIWNDAVENVSDLPIPKIGYPSYDLNGIWLSKFKFDMYRHDSFISGGQFDLELMRSKKKSSYVGKNLQCRCSTKIDYFHKLQCDIYGNILLGKWFNTNTNNCGCYQLHIHNNGNMMVGKHLGNASNNKITCGEWIWIKVEVHESDYGKENFMEANKLLPFNILDEKFTQFIKDGCAIGLNLIVE